MTLIALYIGILLSTSCFYVGFNMLGFPILAVRVLVFGGVWMFAQWRNIKWFSSVALFCAVVLAGFGLVFGAHIGWMIMGAVFALFAWDMTDFHRRLQSLIVSDEIRSMEKRHIARVSLLLLAALAVVSVALFLQFRFAFEWGVFLVIVVMIGLVQLVNWFGRQK